MFKRVLLAFTFVATFSVAGLGLGQKATAWHDCEDDYRYTTAYPYVAAPYSAYVSYAPRAVYYPSYRVRSYPVFYGHYDDHHHHHHNHHSGVSISFGF
jgi:hypothetical protein